MASLVFENVTLDFPIYGAEKSFRSLLKSATGGLIRRDASDKHVTVRAIDNLSLTINHGDRLGIIGHNGAGKSTLLRVCSGVYEPSHGRMHVEGRVSSLFVTSPGLDMEDTGYENIMTCGLFLGMTRQEIAEKTPDIEECSELGEYLTLPVKTYSTGMLTRLGFAIATAIDPEILVLDEGLGAGDARFADKAKKRVDALVERASVLVLASHSDVLIKNFCNRAILMHSGSLIYEGSVDKTIREYKKLNKKES